MTPEPDPGFDLQLTTLQLSEVRRLEWTVPSRLDDVLPATVAVVGVYHGGEWRRAVGAVSARLADESRNARRGRRRPGRAGLADAPPARPRGRRSGSPAWSRRIAPAALTSSVAAATIGTWTCDGSGPGMPVKTTDGGAD